MHEAFIIVALILVLIDALVWWLPTAPFPGGRLLALGLAFFIASFLSAVGGR
jgi:hypothetical protein